VSEEPKQTAVEMGIRIGKTVSIEDWRPSNLPAILRSLALLGEKSAMLPNGHRIDRVNRITYSAGDSNWDCPLKPFVEDTDFFCEK
jgi:hypothetical protein